MVVVVVVVVVVVGVWWGGVSAVGVVVRVEYDARSVVCKSPGESPSAVNFGMKERAGFCDRM